MRTKKSDIKEKKTVKGKKAFPANLLEAFENVVEEVHNSELNEDFFIKAGLSLRYISDFLGLTQMQAVFLSIFVDKSEDTHIRPSEIASFIDIRTVRMLKFMEELEGLVEKHYIKQSKRHDDLTYCVPAPVLKALRKNEPYVHEEEPIKDTQDFFDRYKVLAREKSDDELEYDQLQSIVDELLEEIKDTHFARQLRRLDLSTSNRMLFIFMCHLYVNNDDDNIRFNDIEDLYDDEEIPSRIKRSLRNHENDLFSRELIENVNEDGLARPDAFKVTDKAKEEILSEVSFQNVGKSNEGLMKPEELVEKRLIYNKKEEKLVKELESLLSDVRFKEVQNRLKKSGMRQGFCCLFYGSPGTGKTETVYQLAKATGRHILQVDVDKIKSCWVGESEKNIKGLFDRYRNICKNSDIAPILLFNEADAVLGTRMEGASRAVDKMENSIQNIILQEMEKLEGIMIATTNLTSNLDTAFERRFLYKVKFEKPDKKSRALIWREMIPALKKKDAEVLSEKFNLSGGEIENVARRHTVETILTGKTKIDLKALEESCKLEKLANPNITRIGF